MNRFILAAALALACATGASADQLNISALYPTKAPSSTVSTLPACTSSLQGVRFVVTDALTPVALANVTGGGAVVVGVICNGTTWIIN